MSIEFYWLALVLTTSVSAARLTRLATVDKFPPVKWVRLKYNDWTDASDWWWLMNCGYCFSFWATALLVGWGYLSGVYDFHTRATSPALVWWLFNGTFAMSYVAAVFMAHDADPGDDD